jgi:predicted DNA-binding WGR domain protein
VVLRACDPSLDRYRSWSIEAGKDLFGNWMARVSFGRIGCNGRTIAHEFASEDEVRAFVRKGLRRRQTAVRRLGVAYRVVDASPEAFSIIALAGLEGAGGEWRRG